MGLQGRPYPIYIVLAPFRELAPSVRVLFRGLEKLESHLMYAEGFYREEDDEALFGLQFERQAVRRIGAQRFIQAVGRCNLPVIAPEELNLEKRISFNYEHLTTFPTYVQKYHSPGESLLQGLVLALEEHVMLEESDGDYDMVEVSVEGSTVSLQPDEPAQQKASVEKPLVDPSFPEELIEPVPAPVEDNSGIPQYVEQNKTSQWEVDLVEGEAAAVEPDTESDVWL